MLGRKPSPVIGTLTGSMVSGGVGLGIVAALDHRSEIPANRTVFSRSITGSSSIAVKSSSDEYNYKSGDDRNTKMYGEDRNPFRIQNGAVTSKRPSVFHISPLTLRSGDFDFPPSDFLSSCNLCRRKLHNEDIYMYRGEKAFCSEECRHKVIVTDERNSSSESSSVRAVEVASPLPCADAPAYTAGILAI